MQATGTSDRSIATLLMAHGFERGMGRVNGNLRMRMGVLTVLSLVSSHSRSAGQVTSRQPHTVPARAAPSVAGAAHESLCNNVPERVYEAHDTSTSTTTNSTYIFNRTSTAISVPLFWASGHRFYGRGCDMGLAEPERRRAARRCLRLEMCMETAVVHAYFARHVPKPTRRGCGSAKLYPPEKALHEQRDSNCSHGESARSTSGRG